jgi:Ca2+/Na+ antiporter
MKVPLEIAFTAIIVVAVVLASIMRHLLWPRVVAVVLICVAALFVYFGVQTASRVAIEKRGRLPDPSAERLWDEGAVATHRVAESFLVLEGLSVGGPAVLALLPLSKGSN